MGGASVTETEIAGVLAVDLAVHRDDRGWFKENYHQDLLTAHGVGGFAVVQSNVSFNATAGVLRGIHAEPWEKYVSVASGRVFAAVVDLRAGDAFGRVETFELSPDKALFIPRGCGNAFQTLEPQVVYTYLVNARWSASTRYTGVDPFDPDLAIRWPIAASDAVLSDKDAALPPLREVAAAGTG